MPQILNTLLILAFAAFSVLAGPARAVDSSDGGSDGADTSLTRARDAIDAGDFAAALPILKQITGAEPANADAWNLRGFASRKLGDLEGAARAYDRALTLKPDHLGALEYQGELFLMQGNRAGAEANLARLKTLCGSCEEAEDLADALSAG